MYLRIQNQMANPREPFQSRRNQWPSPLSQTVYFDVGGADAGSVALAPDRAWEGREADLPEVSLATLRRMEEAGAVQVSRRDTIYSRWTFSTLLSPSREQAPQERVRLPATLRAPVASEAPAPAREMPADSTRETAPVVLAKATGNAFSRYVLPAADNTVAEGAPEGEEGEGWEEPLEDAPPSGVYAVTAVGGKGTPVVLTRTDADSGHTLVEGVALSASAAALLQALGVEDTQDAVPARAADLVGEMPDPSTRSERLHAMRREDLMVYYKSITGVSGSKKKTADMIAELMVQEGAV